MADSGSKFLTKMLERLYASLGAGPALNCRPHNSRQRVDLRQLTKIAGTNGEAVIAGVLGSDASIKLSSPRTRASGSSQEEGISDEERAARKAWEDEQATFQKLRLIAEDAKAYEQEFGHHTLNIGFPLLHLPPGQVSSGRFGASKRILAPVAFIPVKLVVKTGRLQSLELACAATGADRVVPNVALLAWIEQQTGTRFEDLFSDEEGVDPWREINELVALVCKSLGLAAPPPLTPGAPLVATPRSDDEDSRESKLLTAAVLGLYPLSNQSLIRDMEAMVAGESISGPIESFLRADLGLGGSIKKGDHLVGRRHFDEDRLVGFADPCQARAVRLARDSKGLVIHGPPGTGKSQTITNVIGDHLARGERVLFVYCPSGLTCTRFDRTCAAATNLTIGSPCTSDLQCASRMCSAWCTTMCTADSDCQPAQGNACVSTSQGTICAPMCRVGGGGATDCAVYGAGYACHASATFGVCAE